MLGTVSESVAKRNDNNFASHHERDDWASSKVSCKMKRARVGSWQQNALDEATGEGFEEKNNIK